MFWMELGVMVIIGSFIGWTTNYVAIKLLFRPHKKINILGFKIQGVIPKRRSVLAQSIAKTVSEELISMSDITETINSMEIEDEIDKIVGDIVGVKLKESIISKYPMAAMFLNDTIMENIKNFVKESIEDNKNELVEIIANKLEESMDLEALIRENIEGFSLDKLEEIVFDLAKAELKHIELIGGILGAIIGLVQFGITRVMV